ncbi:hypothetical protein [Cryobacterium sp. MLB-32]|uniref:hypothetical protein n=1 Tax=Cryobacterium sp. MLB-32 TaxID=1529318 RepID=UPI00055BE81D|nr:hypothetical protein [Cryobacterium sp. MLB-32]
MTSTDADLDRHLLVTGVSAYRLSRVMSVVVGVLAVTVGVLAFFFLQSEGDSDLSGQNIPALIALFGIPVLTIICFSYALGRRGRAEATAGYTTMTSGHQNLDQVDPQSGLIIRRAGSAVYATPSKGLDVPATVSGAVSNASSLNSSVRFEDLPNAQRNRTLTFWGLGTFWIVMLAVAFGIPLAQLRGNSADQMMFLGIMFATVAGAGALGGLIFWIVVTSQRAKVRHAVSARPSAVVFITQRTPELLDALKAIGIDRPRLSLQFVVTIGPEGVELWGRGRTDVPNVALKWRDIDYVHPGRLKVSNGHRSFAVLTLHIFQIIDGRPLDLPIPIFGRRGIGFARAEDANEVLNACADRARIA